LIRKIHTELLLAEIKTDGHAPLKFICDDNNVYYCKYLNAFNRSELNFLAYEVIANRLLNALNIPTPDIALVQVSPGTLNKELIRANRRLKEGNICFGSREIKPAQELQAVQTYSKRDFNKLANPYDVIKIAMFDLWVNNVDRGRFFDNGINYNLLVASENNRAKLVAFDNAFIFGGAHEIGIFNERSKVSSRNKLVESPFYKQVIKHISLDNLRVIVDNLIPLLAISNLKLIKNILAQLPDDWQLTLNLDNRIDRFLTNEQRIISIKNIILHSKS